MFTKGKRAAPRASTKQETTPSDPPVELQRFLDDAVAGKNEEIPGLSPDGEALTEYYGYNGKMGAYTGRIRTARGSLERSTFVAMQKSGKIDTIYEGTFRIRGRFK